MNNFNTVLKNFNNNATDYLSKRLESPKYRGHHLVQHYRYNIFDDISAILRTLDKYAPNKTRLEIRAKDLSKQPTNLPEWKDYDLFCKELHDKIGKGTQDSIRKILFVDLERMGLVCRYNKKEKLNSPYIKNNNNAFVSLTDDGLKVIYEKDSRNKRFIISKFVDKFLNGCIENLLEILRNQDNEIDCINIYEYMFFITAIDFESDFILTKSEAVSYIKEYRKLAITQRKSITEFLKKNMIPDKKDKKGKTKKDFHNWKNETDSLFNNFLSETVYFNLAGTKECKTIRLSTKNGLFNDEKTKLDRSSQQRQKYMENHKIKKKDGFELHHIIPLAWSTSQSHFKMLDNWLNMIYIDAYSHRKVKQHIILDKGKNNQDLKLLDSYNNEIPLIKDKNVLYNYEKQKEMLDKNRDLIKQEEDNNIE